jgi:hypothetical protein
LVHREAAEDYVREKQRYVLTWFTERLQRTMWEKNNGMYWLGSQRGCRGLCERNTTVCIDLVHREAAEDYVKEKQQYVLTWFTERLQRTVWKKNNGMYWLSSQRGCRGLYKRKTTVCIDLVHREAAEDCVKEKQRHVLTWFTEMLQRTVWKKNNGMYWLSSQRGCRGLYKRKTTVCIDLVHREAAEDCVKEKQQYVSTLFTETVILKLYIHLAWYCSSN